MRRSNLEIMLHVLGAIHNGVEKPTRIMYAANLSWNPTQNVLSKLLEQGLIQEFEVESGSRTKKRYDITEKGINVLRYFEGANELIDVLDIFS